MRLQLMGVLESLVLLRPAFGALAAAAPAATPNGLAGPGIRIGIGAIQDSRAIPSTDLLGLNIELELSGKMIKHALAARAFVQTAVDETGKPLVGTGRPDLSFSEFGTDPPKLSFYLKNPVRHEKSLRELSGRVQIYIPKNDPGASALFPQYQQSVGKTFSSPVLTAAGIKIVAWTDEHFKAYEAALVKRIDPRVVGLALGEALPQVFGGMNVKIRSQLVLQVEDPNSRLVTMDIEGPTGKRESPGHFGFAMDKPTTALFIYRFYTDKPPPPRDLRLHVYVTTPKSLMTAPFRLVHIPLP